MVQPKKSPLVLRFTNMLGSLGYIAIIFQFFWLIIAVALPYVQDSGVESLFMPIVNPDPQPITAGIDLPDPVKVSIAIIAVMVSLGLVVYVLIAIPRSIGRFGRNVTDRAAATTVAQITTHKRKHHRPFPLKRQRKLYEYLTWSVKFATALLLLALSYYPLHETSALSAAVVHIIALIFAGFSMFWFGLQWLLTRINKLDARQIW